MRLLVTLDYTKVLFPKSCNYADIIGALEQCQIVEEKGPYGNQVLEAKDKVEIEIKLLADGDIRLPGVPRPESVDRLLAIAKEKETLQSKVRELEAELKKIKDSITPSKETV